MKKIKKSYVSILIIILMVFNLIPLNVVKVYANPNDVSINATHKARISAIDNIRYEELEGASLEIIDNEDNIIAEWVSTMENHEVTGLSSGKEYTLRATYAPDGYTIPTVTTFIIANDGTITSTGSTTMDSSGNTVLLVEFDITHIEVSSIKESDYSKLSEVTIQILDKDGNIVEEWCSSDFNHIVEGLIAEEEYTLRVTVVPDEDLYDIPADITFVIDENGRVTSTGSISEGTLLVSVPEKITYSVTFDLNYDNKILQTISDLKSGSKVEAPDPNPSRDGYRFAGWYANPACTNPFDFNKPITENTTIYAKWNENGEYTIGDLDRNDVVDANDASVALELYKAQNATAEDIDIGDMENNNLIDENDASLILEYFKTHQ